MERELYYKSKEVNLFQIYNMDSGNAMQLGFHVDSNELSFLPSIASYNFCFGRICISITTKFINKVVNYEVTVIFFVVTNLVCVLKKKNLSIFLGLKGGVGTHKNS